MRTPTTPKTTRLEPLVAAGLVAADSPLGRSIAGMLNTLHSEGSVGTYLADVAGYLRFCIASGVDPLAADRDHLQAYLAEIDYRGYAPDTRRRMLSVVRRVYDEAIERDAYTGKNPAGHLGRIKGGARQGEAALTGDEVATLLANAESRIADPETGASLRARRDHLMLSIMIFTAVRAAELAGIERGDVRRHGEYTVIAITGKGDEPDVMKLNEPLERLVRAYLDALDAAAIEVASDDPLFFGIGRGTPPHIERRGGRISPLTTRSIGRIVDEALTAIGRDGHRSAAHLLRRTSVTLVYQATGDLLMAQRQARHKNTATTVEHYIKEADALRDTGIDHIRIPTRE